MEGIQSTSIALMSNEFYLHTKWSKDNLKLVFTNVSTIFIGRIWEVVCCQTTTDHLWITDKISSTMNEWYLEYSKDIYCYSAISIISLFIGIYCFTTHT